MVSAAAAYTTALRERFGYSATWVPNAHVRLGDIGTLQGHAYERVASLADFGVDFEVRESHTRGTYEFASSGSVSFGFKAAGEPGSVLAGLAVTDAGLSVDFSSSDAAVFQAAGCSIAQVADQHRLGEELLRLHSEGRWPHHYVVVTEVIRADRATVLVAAASGARMEFKAQAGMQLGPLSLVAADAGLHLMRSQGMGVQIVAAGDLTPLFRARGIQRRLFREPVFATRGRGARRGEPNAGSSEPGAAFVEVDYADYD
jgi:hypothetical protein